MSHSLNKIWIHSIWATKNRVPIIGTSIEGILYDFIKEQFEQNDCPMRIINGTRDHIHCLFLLNPKKSISEVIKQVKGSSSHFVNQNNFIVEKFSWQEGYASFSVSQSSVEKVYNYINNQKLHHQNKSFQEEYDQFLKLYGLIS